jgi:hypothetical protein
VDDDHADESAVQQWVERTGGEWDDGQWDESGRDKSVCSIVSILHMSVLLLFSYSHEPLHAPVVASMRRVALRHRSWVVDTSTDDLRKRRENGSSGGGLESGALDVLGSEEG